MAAIEAKLTQAHWDAVNGGYQAAIRGHHEAESLVFQQLHTAGFGTVTAVSRATLACSTPCCRCHWSG